MAEGLSRAETVAEVRRTSNRASRAKGRGAGRPRKVTSREFKTAAGPRVTVEFGRGLTPTLIAAALGEILSDLVAETGEGGQAAA